MSVVKHDHLRITFLTKNGFQAQQLVMLHSPILWLVKDSPHALPSIAIWETLGAHQGDGSLPDKFEQATRHEKVD